MQGDLMSAPPLGTYLRHPDALGTPEIMSRTVDGREVSRYGVNAWGLPSRASSVGYDTSYEKHTDQTFEPSSGLVYLHGRWYHPKSKRFMTADDRVVDGGAQGFNRFAYVLNNPLRYTDPTGHNPAEYGESDLGPEDYADGDGAYVEVDRSDGSRDSWGDENVDFDVDDYYAGLAEEASAREPLERCPGGCHDGYQNSGRDPRGGLIIGSTLVIIWSPIVVIGAIELGGAGAAAYTAAGQWAGAHFPTTVRVGLSIGSGLVGGYQAPVPAPRAPVDPGKLASKLCFPKGTPILTPDGSRPIEALQKGDRVYAFDHVSGELVVRTVEQTFINVTDELIEVSYGTAVVSATPSHPFWVDGRGWVAARDLQRGMKLRSPTGPVEVVALKRSPGVRTVYNFSVEREHNYFAGEFPVLVHNQDLDLPNYGAALQEAWGWLQSRGVDPATLTEVRDSRIGSGRGLVVPGGSAGIRIEWDPRNGAHINAWTHSAKSGHFRFPGNQKAVDTLLKLLYCR
jgi:RHS repeat-associated protein